MPSNMRRGPTHAPSIPLAALAALTSIALAPTPIQAASCDVREFDLTISLEASPRKADRAGYEQVIRDFANGVYAATECQHRIGRVEIWRNSQAHDRADIIWRERALPAASANGYGRPGPGMYMTDHFARPDAEGVDPTLNDVSLVIHPTAPAGTAGAMLAHEWAHYAYGLRDEHALVAGDVPVEPSLMNSPWQAATTPEWMNFSIAGPGEGAFENTGKTAQHRAFSRSGWEVLADTEVDLAELLTSPLPGIALRTAAGLEAPAPLPLSGESGGTGALDIVWQDRCAAYVIAVDNSGSMTGNSLNLAKGAARALVEGLSADATWLALLSFHETVVPRRGPSLVSDEEDGSLTERQRFLDAIDLIAAVSKPTKFSVGLDAALAAFETSETCTGPVATRAVFFLSDGSNSEGEDLPGGALDVALTAYEDAGIPIQVLNVGSQPESLTDLVPLANRTGGLLFGPSASGAQAEQALDESQSNLDFVQPIGSGTITVAPMAVVAVDLPIDSTFTRLRICANSTGTVLYSFHPPSGVLLLPTRTRPTEDADDTCSTFFTSARPEAGTWQLVATAAVGATEPVDVTYDASATARGATYLLDVSIANSDDGTVEAPDPILVLASLWNGRPIAGAHVEMSVDDGDPVPLRDDGLSPDAVADDGLYAGAATYDTAGCEGNPSGCPTIVVRATNEFDSATFTSNGLIVGSEQDGTVGTPPRDQLVAEDLERSVTLSVATLAGAPAAPIASGAPVSGDIETLGGAADRFEIDVCAVLPDFATTPEPLEVRVSGALLGMAPRLEVFRGADATPHASATAEDRAAGVAVVVDASALDCGTPIYAEVSHATGGTGTYQISAGPVLDLVFGRAGPGNSPCEIARLYLDGASAELARLPLSLPAAEQLVDASREIQENVRSAIDENATVSPNEKEASKLLRKSIQQAKKAKKLIQKTEKQLDKYLGLYVDFYYTYDATDVVDQVIDRLEKIEKEIRNARDKLDDACVRLPDGGEALLGDEG